VHPVTLLTQCLNASVKGKLITGGSEGVCTALVTAGHCMHAAQLLQMLHILLPADNRAGAGAYYS